MNRNFFYVIMGLTFCSILLILIFFLGKKPPKEPQETFKVERPPFSTFVNGVGVVEPKSGNIYIGIPFERIVKKINVSVNDQVKIGDILLELDHEDLTANLKVKQKEYEGAKANYQKLQALPRKEDITVAEEALKKAQVALNESSAQYQMVINLPNPGAISKEEQDKRQYNYQRAQAEYSELKAQLEKIKSGTWQPELKIALYEVEKAQAGVEAINAEIQRTYIKSPIDGTVLQIKIREGETSISDQSKTAIIVGNLDELNLRVSIDQFHICNLPTNATAVAFRQGDRATRFPIEFIHKEPFMVPKKYLTNITDEKVDTLVFEILYRITKKDPNLLIGEQMDVYIDKEKK